jgi:NAD(P)H-dependent FMN reductase
MTISSIEPGNMDGIENTNGHSINPKPKKIALIICSTRTKRIGPQLASWLSTHLPTPPDQSITLQTIDLAQYLPSLPLSPNNSILPYYVLTPLGENPYEEGGTNAWSRVVRGFDGFVWLTPEYNWCFPAAVKIAVDLLFHEWKGKPALVVSYGNEGGGKAGQALRGVLECVRCHSVS